MGVAGLYVEGELHHSMEYYLDYTFGIHTEHHEDEGGVLGGLNPIALASSLAAFGIGITLGYVFYIRRAVSARTVVNSNIFFYAIHKVMLNRWYLNAMVYWCFVVAPAVAGAGRIPLL